MYNHTALQKFCEIERDNCFTQLLSYTCNKAFHCAKGLYEMKN